MLIHRGEAWLDAGPPGSSDVPGDNVANGLATNVHFEERAETRPEEVLATAHAASFCLSLWKRLQSAGHAPRSVHTVAVVHHPPTRGSARAESEIFLNAEVDIPGVGEETLLSHAKAAKGDFVALRGLSGVPVSLEHRLLH